MQTEQCSELHTHISLSVYLAHFLFILSRFSSISPSWHAHLKVESQFKQSPLKSLLWKWFQAMTVDLWSSVFNFKIEIKQPRSSFRMVCLCQMVLFVLLSEPLHIDSPKVWRPIELLKAPHCYAMWTPLQPWIHRARDSFKSSPQKSTQLM